jgi:hypothetical protein
MGTRIATPEMSLHTYKTGRPAIPPRDSLLKVDGHGV